MGEQKVFLRKYIISGIFRRKNAEKDKSLELLLLLSFK